MRPFFLRENFVALLDLLVCWIPYVSYIFFSFLSFLWENFGVLLDLLLCSIPYVRCIFFSFLFYSFLLDCFSFCSFSQVYWYEKSKFFTRVFINCVSKFTLFIDGWKYIGWVGTSKICALFSLFSLCAVIKQKIR